MTLVVFFRMEERTLKIESVKGSSFRNKKHFGGDLGQLRLLLDSGSCSIFFSTAQMRFQKGME